MKLSSWLALRLASLAGIANLFGKRDSYGGYYGRANFAGEAARAIASVANGRVFFPVGSQVICLGSAT